MEGVTLLDDLPALRRPVLIAAFEGWNDAGESASLALDVIRSSLDADPLAVIDAEEFFDFQAVRPMVRLDAHGGRIIDWPENRFWTASSPAGDRDLVFLDGVEPNLRWRTFTDGIVELAERLGVELLVTLGALQVDVPHTRAVPLTVSTQTPELAERLDLSIGSYEGPTGITGVLHAAASAVALPAVSVWAGVPHYLASSAYLPGALALAERVSTLVGAELPLGDLARDAARQADDIAELVASDEDLTDYVGELEDRFGPTPLRDLADSPPDRASLPRDPDDLPEAVDGDAIADELERFLRDRKDR
ncbi:PAC2 family protein [soil metagenome]